MMEGQFQCWMCGLWWGASGSPILPSQLCGCCKANISETLRPMHDPLIEDELPKNGELPENDEEDDEA
jgi:hypothetical protein